MIRTNRPLAAFLLLLPAGILSVVGGMETAIAAPGGSVVTVTSDMAEMGMDPLLDNTGNVKVFTLGGGPGPAPLDLDRPGGGQVSRRLHHDGGGLRLELEARRPVR
jgi:hypothetical protein